jgi:hypothetical protein
VSPRLSFGVAALVLAGWLSGAGGCAARTAASGLSTDDTSTSGDDGGAEANGDDSGASSGDLGPIPVFGNDSGGGPGAIGPSCAGAVAQAKRQPAYLLFVLDGSDSMAQDNKWTAATAALTSVFDQMKTAADPGVAAGLIVFPAAGGPFPAAGDVPLGFVDAAQAGALDARLMTALALGTPTNDAMTGGYGELEAFQAKAPLQAGGKKVLILITDGVPTDACASLLGLGNYASNACVTLAKTKLGEGAPGPVETFVVGVGAFPSTSAAGFDPAFLGNVASAGGTGPKGCNPNETSSTTDLCYFEIDPTTTTSAGALQAKFEAALDAIRGQVVSCTFPLQSTGLGKIDPMLVNVELNGKPILMDPKNGWSYDNPATPTAIVLNGSACTTVTTDLTVKVDIVVGCYTQAAK